jgi:cell division protein ZapA
MNALSPESVKVKIMDRDYVFACAPDEKESLMRCVALVDEKMNTIKNMGKLTQIDRIAVMAALMIASDFMAHSSRPEKPDGLRRSDRLPSEYHEPELDRLQQKLDQYLSKLKPQLNIEGKGLFG